MKKLFFKIEVLFSIVMLVVIVGITRNYTPEVTWNPAKALGIGIYYFFMYTEEWFSVVIFFISVVTVWICRMVYRKRKVIFLGVFNGILVSTVTLILCFSIVVFRVGNIYGYQLAEQMLMIMSLLWWELCLIGITGCQAVAEQKDHKSMQRGTMVMLLLLVATCLPVIYAGRYVFPQADDFSYGSYCYQAFCNGEGLVGVLSGAGRKVAESYTSWQGTFSSIFLMALQPGIWGTEFYHVVPLLMIVVLVFAILFFFYVILCKCCKATLYEALFIGSAVAVCAVQMTIAKISAFFWYNGAVHYLWAYSMLLNFASFLLYMMLTGKRKILCTVVASLMAIMVGGGNLVTALLGMIVLAGFVCTSLFIKNKRLVGYLVFPGVFMATAFLVNVLAPGNYIRQSKSGEFVEYGAIGSILKSFQVCLEFSLTEWTNWFLILFLLVLLPVVHSITKRMKFHFPLPGIVVLGSLCLLASMYTPLIYALGNWNIGRTLNIIYYMFLILCALNELYLVGWIEKHDKMRVMILACEKVRVGIVVFILVYVGLVLVAEPERLTSSAVVTAIISGEADEYAEIISRNIEILETSEEEEIVLERPPQRPAIFTTLELDPWRMGTPLYYGKRSVRYEDEVVER